MTAAPATFDRLGHTTPDRDLAALSSLVKSLPGVVVCVEVGVWVGQSTRAMLDAGAGRVYAIDHWQGNPGDQLGSLVQQHGGKKAFETFAANMGGDFLRKVIPLIGDSRTWALMWPFPVDLIYIDADHRYEAVKEDIWRWAPHVRPGGILCGHDYGIFDGVEQAVHEIFEPEELTVQGNVWAVRMQ